MIPAIFGIAGETLTDDERAFFKACDPAGYILFARNCVHRDQLRALTDDLRSLHGREATFISIDQEGGRVARMKAPEWANYPAGEAFDRLYAQAPASAIEAARANARAMGAELAAMGITVDFHAPMDVRRPETDNVIGDRALGSDPMQVAALGRAVIDGLADAGVAGCDAELEVDIAPFSSLAEYTKIGMSAHITFTAWDAQNPATLSTRVIEDVIRGRIGFEGLLLTDDIDMQALDGTIAERSAKAIAERRLAAALEVSANAESILDCGELLAKRDALLSLTETAA